jgi:beta-mannosidase
MIMPDSGYNPGMTTFTLDLGGTWTLSDDAGEHRLPATVPGCVHTDLLAAGRIPDPNWRDNEAAIAWVHHRAWTCTRTFTCPPEMLARKRIWLACAGLDTVAVVSVNGTEVLRADNMYRTWEVDLRPVLRPGANTISVHFPRLVPLMQAEEAAHRVLYAQNVYHADFTGKSYIRKMPCSFGWDWGLMAPTAGIWRSIAIQATDHGRIGRVRLTQRHTPGRVVLVADVTHDGLGSIHLTCAGQTVVGRELTIDQPRLWWPNGLGDQSLYDVRIELIEDGRVVDVHHRRIGLRTLELVQVADQWGESFGFAVNGLRFFAKGANWIPDDIFPSRISAERYRTRVAAAAEAGMNMLRVWGGGIYEAESFYDACDELGVLVWQDFMFSCSTYPTFLPEFMANVRVEAEQQVNRLHHRACLALWCGNNELEQGLVGETWTNRTMSWADYAPLFDRLLPEIVAAEDGTTPYWPCSPHSNLGNRYDHASDRCGDAHAWSVWFGGLDFEAQRTWNYRFMSEFGFQSFPEPATVASFTVPEDRNLTSRIMDYHQRSKSRGNKTIFSYVLEWFRMPATYEDHLWQSQLTQALCIQYAAEHTRRMQPRTEGCLYWQLNDLWPAATWSSIDCFGRWKALQYLAKRFFAPILVAGVEDPATGAVAVHLSNHRSTALSARICWRVTDAAGEELGRGELLAMVPAQADVCAGTVDCQAWRIRAGAADISAHEGSARTGVLGMYRADADLLVWLEAIEGATVLARNLVLFARPKHLDLHPPGISWTIAADGTGSRIAIRAARPALWVHLHAGDARFSDNWFHLDGRQERHLTSPVAPAELQAALTVRSLVDRG